MDGENREIDTTFVNGDENCIGVGFSLLDNGSVDDWTRSMTPFPIQEFPPVGYGLFCGTSGFATGRSPSPENRAVVISH